MNGTRSSINDLKPGTVAVIGVPSDENSSFMSGAALAPPRIREVLHSGSTNLSAESGLHLVTDPPWPHPGDSTRGLLQPIQGLRAPIVGADIVEYNPERDLADITSMKTAKLLKEVVACMIEGKRPEEAA
jgi:arginase family enzyme